MITVPPRFTRTPSPEVRIDRFGGVDYSTVPTLIAYNRAEDMENCLLDQRGMLQQIAGYRKAITGAVSAGASPVRMLAWNEVGKKFVKSHGGSLYTFEPEGGETLLYTGVADAPMTSFVMGEYQYFMDGENFLRWDGIGTVEEVDDVAFIPTTTIGRAPSGGGVTLEAVNLINPFRINSFIGDGSSAEFQLDTYDLDSDEVSAKVDGVDAVEGVDFSVDRTTGKITFTSAPPDGSGVDNVIITFAKTVDGYADRIKKCKFNCIFGVGNNLRVFVSGNEDFANQDWYSGMQDPAYWPDLSYTKIGSENNPIKGYALQQSAMHILKADSGADPTIWTRSADMYTDGTLYFPVRPNNSSVGLIATESVKTIDDVSVFLSRKGVYRIVATYIADERGLEHISELVDKRLLLEENLEEAVSFDHDGRYGIAVGDYIYVIDYKNGLECYRWKGIDASCFLEREGKLYFGSRNDGNVYIVNSIHDDNLDMTFDGKTIEAIWKGKIMSMEKDNFFKMIDTMSVTMVPMSTRSNVDIFYRTNKRGEKFVKQVSVSTFDANDIDANDISCLTVDMPQTMNREINVSDIVYFQVILKNDRHGYGMSVSNITIPFSLAGEI